MSGKCCNSESCVRKKPRNSVLNIDLSEFYEDHRSKARIFVGNLSCIAEIEEKITKLFNIADFYLHSEDGSYLPSLETIEVLIPDECIRVKQICGVKKRKKEKRNKNIGQLVVSENNATEEANEELSNIVNRCDKSKHEFMVNFVPNQSVNIIKSVVIPNGKLNHSLDDLSYSDASTRISTPVIHEESDIVPNVFEKSKRKRKRQRKTKCIPNDQIPKTDAPILVNIPPPSPTNSCKSKNQPSHLRFNDSIVEVSLEDYPERGLIACGAVMRVKLIDKTPEVGDILEFKIFRLTQEYNPEVSDRIVGRIINFEPELHVTLDILEGHDQCLEPNGKFMLNLNEKSGETADTDNKEADDNSMSGENNDTSKRHRCFAWTDLIDPHFILPNPQFVTALLNEE